VFAGNNLTGITIPSGVGNIAASAFNNCGLLAASIPSSVTNIGDNAFDNCSLTEASLSSAVTSIGNSAFANNQLASVTIPPSVTRIGDSAFANNRLASVAIPASVTSLGASAFNQNWLTSIVIPGSISLIGDSVFANNRLTSVTIPLGVTGIGDSAFAENPLLQLEIPDGVTRIGNSAFADSSLPVLVLPDSLESIGDSAFYYSSLATLIIPAGVTNIGDSAFICNNLTAVYFLGNAPYNDNGTALSDNNDATAYYLSGASGWGSTYGGVPTKELAQPAICTTNADNTITISGYIGRGAVTIPATINGLPVTVIAEDAFRPFASITSVFLPATVTTIDPKAFAACSRLTTVIVDPANPVYSTTNGVLFNKSQTVLVKCPQGVTGTYVIPSTVTTIGEDAFEGCSGLTNVVFPEGLTCIGDPAFGFCSNLTTLRIPASVTSIGDYAFAFCSNLTTVYFDGDAPADNGTVFFNDLKATVYYLPEANNWGPMFGSVPTAKLQGPVALPTTVWRTNETVLIPFSSLAGAWSDPNGLDPVALAGVNRLSANLVTLSANASGIVYTTTRSVSDQIVYSITNSLGMRSTAVIDIIYAPDGKAMATVTLSDLFRRYTGGAISATVTTLPENLAVDLTYNGLPSAPTAIGSYAVTGTVNEAMYQGIASGTLVVAKAIAQVTLNSASLSQTYNRSERIVTAATVPAGLTVGLTYQGSAVPPTNVGVYAVVATVTEAHYEGAATGTLTVAKANQTITFPNPGQQVVTNTVVLGATSTSALTVGFSVDAGPAVISDAVNLSFSSAGRGVRVRAEQGGDANWNAGDVTHTFDVIGVITNVTPSSGTACGGTQVAIAGLCLGSGSDITNVTLCNVPATIITQGLHSVTVTAGVSPAGTNGDVVVQSAGFGTMTLTNGFTYQPVLLPPTALSAINVTSTLFTACWTTSAGATSYLIDVSTTDTFASFTRAYSNLNVGDVTACLVTGLVEQTTYYYRVRAANGYGSSTNSNTIEVPTSGNTIYNLSTSFQGSTLATNLFLDVPDPNVGTITLNTEAHKLQFSGPGADMWWSRNGLPFAWTPVPSVGLGGKWQAETQVQFYDTSDYGRIVGMTTYSGPDGRGGSDDGQEFTFGLDHWDDPNGVWVQGLGDHSPGDSPDNIRAALNTDIVDLRMVVTVGADNLKTFDFYYKDPSSETWTSLGTIHHANTHERVALFFKGSDMNVTFNYFNVTTLAMGVEYAVVTNLDNTLTITGYFGSANTLVIPSQIDGLTVSGIGDSAFFDRSSLVSVTIPDSVTTIGNLAFFYCIGLTSVTLPDSLVSIGDAAFYNCSSLTSLAIPNSVTAIGSSAFGDCSGLTSVTLPDSLVSIGEGAFYNCNTLASVTIPSHVASIANYAFMYSDSLTSVYFSGNPPALGSEVFTGDWRATLYYLPGTTGWEAVSSETGLPALLWNPVIQAGEFGFGPTREGFRFTVTGTPDIPIRVDACTNLSKRIWTPLLTTRLSSGSLNFMDDGYGSYPSRFYRISGP
jgi:hypothetical protein